jgi:IS5 family transposase
MQGTSESDAKLLDAAALCGHLVPDGSVHAFLAGHRKVLFPDEMFEDLFGSSRGRPSVPADVIATVMVLQALEGASDREALMQLRTNIAWKAACGLSLADEGFHPTVLTLWRNRLRASEAPQRIFDAVREVIASTSVLARRDRRAIDATVLDDAVATQDTVTQLVSAIRRVRRTIPAARQPALTTHPYDTDPGKPDCAWDDAEAREALVSALVADALVTLAAAASDLELSDDQQEAVGLLALVARQDVEPGDREGTWRIATGTTRDRMVSVVDPASRHVHKTVHSYRDGYKAHIAVEPETGLVTACGLTPGNAPEASLAEELVADEPAPVEILADSAYSAGATRVGLRAAGHTLTIKPPPLRSAIDGGFTKDDFTIDFENGTVTCPADQTVMITPAGNAVFGGRCRDCPFRDRCTTAKQGKTFVIHPHERVLIDARRTASTEQFQIAYRRWRPMVERSIAWLVAHGHRKVRYRGTDRNQMWWSVRCAAVNLKRLLVLGLVRENTGWVIA